MDNKYLENLEKTAKLFSQAISFCVLRPTLNEMAREELTEVQLSCLRFVSLHPEPSVGEIADGLRISNAASAKLIDRLVKKNLLSREEDPQDRRVLKIKLTTDGRKLLEAINIMELQQFNGILQQMSKENLQKLAEGLVAFLKAALLTPEQIDEICMRCGSEHALDCPGNLLYHELTGHDKERV